MTKLAIFQTIKSKDKNQLSAANQTNQLKYRLLILINQTGEVESDECIAFKLRKETVSTPLLKSIKNNKIIKSKE